MLVWDGACGRVVMVREGLCGAAGKCFPNIGDYLCWRVRTRLAGGLGINYLPLRWGVMVN